MTNAVDILDRFGRDVELREATLEDAALISSFYGRMVEDETGVALTDPQMVRVMQWACDVLDAGETHAVIAVLGGDPVGLVIAHPIWQAPEDARPILSVFSRWVMPEARRYFVGHALMRACYTLADQLGCEGVTFYVRPGRRTGLYERLGCSVTGLVFEGRLHDGS